MFELLKFSIITLTISYCICAETKNAYDGYYRFKDDQKEKSFYPMSLDQIKDSPIISSMVEKKISTNTDEESTSGQKSNPETYYYGSIEDPKSPPFDKYFEPTSELKYQDNKEYANLEATAVTPLSDLKSYFSSNSYLESKEGPLSPPLSKFYEKQSEYFANEGSGGYSDEKYTPNLPQLQTYSNSIPYNGQKAYADQQQYRTTPVKDTPWVPITNRPLNLNYEQQSYGNYDYQNSGPKQDSWTPKRQIIDYEQTSYGDNSNFNSELNSKSHSQANYGYAKANPNLNAWNQLKNTNYDSNRDYYGNNPEVRNTGYRRSGPKVKVYHKKNHVSNNEPNTEYNSNNGNNDGNPALLDRFLNLNRNRFRVKKMTLDDFMLSSK